MLDVDPDGHETLRALERDYSALPRTASVVTPRGGGHYYFRHPSNTIAVPNSAGRLGPGLDVRDGGYVLAPPSIGATGRRYEPDERAPISEMPGWLRQLVIAPQTGRTRPSTPVTEWTRIVRDGLAEGERNAGLARLVGHLLARNVDVELSPSSRSSSTPAAGRRSTATR